MVAGPATPVVDRRQPLLKHESAAKSGFGEVAGSTAAACAAVCCCCPCGLATLLVFAVVKVPAELCRKAIRRKKQVSLRNELKRSNTVVPQVQPLSPSFSTEDFPKLSQVTEEGSPMEDEMFLNFHTGFWRNPSLRE